MLTDRYERQIVLPEVGPQGQARLAEAHVAVVGAGGLGSAVIPYLAGAGVGRLTLVDPDRVSESNLHRQTLYRESDVGRLKSEVAAEVVEGLNRSCRARSVPERLDPDTWTRCVDGADVVLDCADSFAATYVLSDGCRSSAQPLVSASAIGLTGYVGSFCGGGPSVRAVFPELPDRAGTCASGGVLGPVVGVLGCLQAQMTLSILLEWDTSPVGQLVTYDGRTLKFGGFRFDGAEEPDEPILRFISPGTIRPGDFVVDLRDASEAAQPVTDTARRLPVERFGPGGPMPSPGQQAVLCCKTGLRAWRAARRLQRVWTGEVSLVALGSCPPVDSPSTPIVSPGL